MVHIFLRGVDGLCRWSAYGAALILAASFALGFAEILSRAFFKYSIPVAFEYNSYMLALIMFGGSAWALRDGGHIRVTLLFQAIGPGPRRVVDLAATIFALAVSLYLARAFIVFTMGTYERGTLSIFPSETPLAWPQTALAFALSIISLALIARIIRLLLNEETESTAAGAALENLEPVKTSAAPKTDTEQPEQPGWPKA